MSQKHHWYKEAIIYEVHVKCFSDSSGNGIGDFKGLTAKLDYLQDLGITAIWLLPFYPSPLKDDGYDIADYKNIHQSYGSLADFKQFLKQAHKRGLKVITELVINHTSDQHPWFQKSRKGGKWRDYYVWSKNPEKYKQARIIFQDYETSNWSWDSEAKEYYWHRFFSHQPDLNFENPEVHKNIFDVLRFWLEMGVDGVRLDAVPYLYEEEGTICENLEQTHAFLKSLRKFVDENFSDRMLLAEANQWPEDASKYFGDGDECHMAFHFPVMPRLFMAIHLEDCLPIIEIMEQTPEIADNCQWALFLRNHDELTLEMVTDEERDYMFRVYAHDPQARHNLGIRRRLAPLLKNDRRKIELMNALLFSLTGTPVIYYGDELGMGDNIYLGDRDGVRTPMQWSWGTNAGFSSANPQSLYLPPIIDPEYHYETVNVDAQQNNSSSLLWWTKQLIALRKRFSAFGQGSTTFLTPENRKVLVFFREFENERLLIVANLSRFPQYVKLDLAEFNEYYLIELFSGQRFPNIGTLPYFLTLGPYGYYWFAVEKEAELSALTLRDRKKESQVNEVHLEGEITSIFTSDHRSFLSSLVKTYLFKRVWFKEKLPYLDKSKTKLVDHLALPSSDASPIHLLFFEVVYTNTKIERYPLFIAYLSGAEAQKKIKSHPERVVAQFQGKQPHILYELGEEQTVAQLLRTIIDLNSCLKGEHGKLCGVKLPLAADSVSFSTLGKELKSPLRLKDRVLFPEKEKILKLFTYAEEGINLDLQMRLFLLKKATFNSVLPLTGYIDYRFSNGNSVTIAEELVDYPKEFSAKHMALEEAERFLLRMEAQEGVVADTQLVVNKKITHLSGEKLDKTMHEVLEGYLEVAHLLGETTARFHKALSGKTKEEDFSPVPFSKFHQRSLYQTQRQKISEGFRILRLVQTRSHELERICGEEQKILDLTKELLSKSLHGELIRIHGNFTLNHVIYLGKEFLLTNFDGNRDLPYSERKFKRSAIRDLAQMQFSFLEVAHQAVIETKKRGVLIDHSTEQLKKWAKTWAFSVGASFFRTYLKKSQGANYLPESREEFDLLCAHFLIEQSMEKIISEARGDLWTPLSMLSYILDAHQ